MSHGRPDTTRSLVRGGPISVTKQTSTVDYRIPALISFFHLFTSCLFTFSNLLPFCLSLNRWFEQLIHKATKPRFVRCQKSSVISRDIPLVQLCKAYAPHAWAVKGNLFGVAPTRGVQETAAIECVRLHVVIQRLKKICSKTLTKIIVCAIVKIYLDLFFISLKQPNTLLKRTHWPAGAKWHQCTDQNQLISFSASNIRHVDVKMSTSHKWGITQS